MGNMITSERNNDPAYVKMSNGLTDAVLCMLVVSGSALATTEREKDLVVWLASHDQSIYGLGAVGFDLSELPWTTEQFEVEKQFLLRVITSCKTKEYWHLFDYDSHGDVVVRWIIPWLETLEQMIERLRREAVHPAATLEWWQERPPELRRCPLHSAYLHRDGCIVCNVFVNELHTDSEC